MPVETYSTLPDTVLAYKKTHQIGRFDPHAPELKERKVADLWKEIAEGSMSPMNSLSLASCALKPVDPGHDQHRLWVDPAFIPFARSSFRPFFLDEI